MQIRTKLVLMVLIPVGLSLLTAGALYRAQRQVNRTWDMEKVTDGITRSVFELNLTTHQFLLHPEERPRVQFQAIYASLKKTLAGIQGETEGEREIIESMRQNQEAMGFLFSLVAGKPARGEVISPELRERSTGRLLAASQGIVSNSFTLAQMRKNRMDANVRGAFFFSLAFALFAGMAMVIFLSLLGTNVLRADRELQQEMAERLRAEEALRRSRDEMEDQVRKRTAELTGEIEARKRSEESLKESQDELRHLSDQLLITQEKERREIARELHDHTWQLLNTIMMDINYLVAQQAADDLAAVRRTAERILGNLRKAIGRIRSMQGDLWPPVLEDIGLLATITWYCREFKEENPGISIDQEIGLAEEAVPEQARIVIYRVMQEALRNVVKHSGADRVLVSLKPVGEGLEFSIHDNGPGFDLERLLFRTRLWTGFGLLGLKEKVEHSGGTFEVRSGEGKGTTLSARWSLTGAADQAAGGRRPFRSPSAEQEEPFRIITENISDWVYAFRVERDDRIVWEWVTRGFTTVTGYEKDVDLIEILHPDDRIIIAERFHSIKALQPIVNEYRVVTKNGEIRWIRDSINPAADVLHPGVFKVVGAAQDITERKKAEKALESLARLPEENPNPVLRIAVNGGLLNANAAARAWLAEGWHWQPDTPPPEIFTALVAKASISGQVFEEEITCPAGRTFWITAVHPPSEDYVTLYGREITLRKQAENEIQRHLEELQGRNEELLRFNQVAVDRELRMIELKRQVNALCALTGQPPKYKLDFGDTLNDVPITTPPI